MELRDLRDAICLVTLARRSWNDLAAGGVPVWHCEPDVAALCDAISIGGAILRVNHPVRSPSWTAQELRYAERAAPADDVECSQLNARLADAGIRLEIRT